MPNRIKELREERKMTQLRLSMELGVSQETISAYEVGKHYPSINSLLKMVGLFHASMDYIMGLTDFRIADKVEGLPNDEAGLLLLYRSLNSTQKEKTVAYIHGMLE